MSYRRKLIEVAMPLDGINKESVREKSLRHGHPSTLHLWWSRKPLATARAVLFASLVDDPSNDLPEEEARKERERLFALIEKMVKWENSHDETVLYEVRLEIAKSIAKNKGLFLPNQPTMDELLQFLAEEAPLFLDPFAGGGSIPLEAQRLGLKTHASDLNPVAVLLNKALIEIPPRFADSPPVNPDAQKELVPAAWKGTAGLAQDILYYGKWMKEEAEKRIGHFYPKVTLPEEMGGEEATVIAWLWARTVTCPNPACGAEIPLTSKFWLAKKKNKEVWAEPIIDRSQQPAKVRFEVRYGKGKVPEGTVNRRGATCLCCDTPVPLDHIRSEGQAGRMDSALMAIVADGEKGRVYLSPLKEHEEIAKKAQPEWIPSAELEGKMTVSVPLYGISAFGDLFTPRQLLILNTFSDLLIELKAKVQEDAKKAGIKEDATPLAKKGDGTRAYAEAIAVYLALAIDRCTDYWSAFCSWNVPGEKISHTFTRQAIPMVWDYAECNGLSQSSGNWLGAVAWVAKVVERLTLGNEGNAEQQDAASMTKEDWHSALIISTDPPYYDNIVYADLADFFYVWLRKNLRSIYPELFATMLVPKAEELVATPFRFQGDKKAAKRHFEEGLQRAFMQMKRHTHPDFPLTIYYAFKQQENLSKGKSEKETASTGWETMLNGLFTAGFQITGTWPIRTERTSRSVALGTNALASSIVLVCRSRSADSPIATRREFMSALRNELPKALNLLQEGNIAPVDLAQSMIGPGISIYSRYSQVLESDGTPMTVRRALAIINQVLDELLSAEEGEYDADTRWALAWFEQYGMNAGSYGDAETLSLAKNTSVEGLQKAGILEARAGKVRLLTRDEYPDDWNPQTDKRFTLWEATQHLIRTFERQGEQGAAQLLAQCGERGEYIRELAYRLYSICERKGWAQEATVYNTLVVVWPRLQELVRSSSIDREYQRSL